MAPPRAAWGGEGERNSDCSDRSLFRPVWDRSTCTKCHTRPVPVVRLPVLPWTGLCCNYALCSAYLPWIGLCCNTALPARVRRDRQPHISYRLPKHVAEFKSRTGVLRRPAVDLLLAALLMSYLQIIGTSQNCSLRYLCKAQELELSILSTSEYLPLYGTSNLEYLNTQ